jgi:hypothetical protein
MTWVVGFNGFNGVLCVADVQVTFPFLDSSRTPLYRDCLKKIHRLWDNAYVAFCGDVRVGLLLIADLQKSIEASFEEGMLFTLEDRLGQTQETLRHLYAHHANGKTPDLELMVAFVHQFEDNVEYVPALCRFIAPEFRFNSSCLLQVDQCGSGKRSPELRVISEFLAGRQDADQELYNRIFPNVKVPPTVSTIKKLRTLLTSEAAHATHPGVSKMFCSAMAQIGFDEIWSASDNETIFTVMTELGLHKVTADTRADQLITYELDIGAIHRRLEELRIMNPVKYEQLRTDFTALTSRAHYEALTKRPVFVEEFHSSGSSMRAADLCTTWPEMVAYMNRQGIPVNACAAIA